MARSHPQNFAVETLRFRDPARAVKGEGLLERLFDVYGPDP
jgi:hypothetical protein